MTPMFTVIAVSSVALSYYAIHHIISELKSIFNFTTRNDSYRLLKVKGHDRILSFRVGSYLVCYVGVGALFLGDGAH